MRIECLINFDTAPVASFLYGVPDKAYNLLDYIKNEQNGVIDGLEDLAQHS